MIEWYWLIPTFLIGLGLGGMIDRALHALK